MDFSELKHNDWTKIWAGQWSFLSCAHFGAEWTRLFKIYGAPPATHEAFVSKRGTADAYITVDDRAALGKRISAVIFKDPNEVKIICSDFKKETDRILAFIESIFQKPITLEIYEKFWQHVDSYYQVHIRDKYAPDYLPPNLLGKYLPLLEDARVYAEPVFKRTEEFMNHVAIQVGARVNIAPKLVLCALPNEFLSYLAGKPLPPKAELEARYEHSALIYSADDCQVWTGAKVAAVEKELIRVPLDNTVRGVTAYKGKVAGIARIIFDPGKVMRFQDGDILVSAMTRPEFLPLIKKSAGFVTDGGGILCHAAIVARELKKPCVIDTQVATTVFRDGDMVEIDADNGVVKKLKT